MPWQPYSNRATRDNVHRRGPIPTDHWYMRKLKIVTALAVLIVSCNVGWQIAVCEVTSVELHDDMKDMASQIGGRIGLASAKSDEDFRNDILSKAKKYDIPLTPEEVTVQRTGVGFMATMYFAADYSVPIHLPGFTFQLHFNPESGPKPD
jgi:hypothetical protein